MSSKGICFMNQSNGFSKAFVNMACNIDSIDIKIVAILAFISL